MKRKHESPKKSRNPLQMIQSRPEYQQHDIWFCILTQLAFSEPMQLQRCSRISSMFAATIERVKIAFVRDFIARYQKARDVNQLCDPDHEQRLIAAGFDVDTVYKEFLFPKLVQSDISFNDYRCASSQDVDTTVETNDNSTVFVVDTNNDTIDVIKNWCYKYS
eukprot:TRINITY_DN564_c0_g1_i2.p1 TRINITY_DN564_c0_g1~~TRINITY_DN564_c0_g1_i2.p1  ORF type:complete len:163 (-),score=27.69 TRINITY_DN564_c0_g1_i2:15-503(-)